MVKSVREVEEMLGEIDFTPKKGRDFARSLYVVKDIKQGEIFTSENIKSIRPGYGLHPKYLPKILGKRSCVNLEKGEPLQWENIY